MRRILNAAAIVVGGVSVLAVTLNQLSAQQTATAGTATTTAPKVATYPAGQGVSVYAPASSDPFFTTSGNAYWTGQNVTPEAAARMREESTLDHQAGDLVRKYGATEDSAKKDEIKKQLGDVLAKQFQLQQSRREEEVKEVEKKLQKLKELIGKRSDQKSKIIDKRLDQLLSDAEGLGWNSGGNSVRAFSFGSSAPAIAAPRASNSLLPSQNAPTTSSSSSSSGGASSSR